MSNKRDLKSYVRFDGNGQLVPGSNILARKKPKVGEWYEGPAYLCCNTTTAYPTALYDICISGLRSNTEWNGTYTYIEMSEGKPHYQKESIYDIYWDGTQWWIGDIIYSTDDVDTPVLVTTWIGTGGGMLVSEGACTTTTTTTLVTTTTTTTPSATTSTTTTTIQ